MKQYSLSLTMTCDDKELAEAGLSHLTEKEIQEHLEEQFNEVIQGSDYFSTEFKVEEV